MINFKKPKFWDLKRISLISIILFPFSIITYIIIYFKKNFSDIKDFEIPVICVGNIYIGGTGKTPTSMFLAKELSNIGIKSVILRKYYKNHGDEYNQIRNNFNELIISKSRILGVKEAKTKNYDTIICDDGLQDYKIKKKLSIACFNSNQLIGNGFLLPSGPLRESLSALKNVNIVIINGDKKLDFEDKILKINKDLRIFYSYYKPLNVSDFKKHKLLAIAGIGNPENFFLLLKKNNLIVEKKLIFPDHYKFNKYEIQKIIDQADQKKLKIIMTEKDYFKVNKFKLNKLNYLKVSLEIPDKENFMHEIRKIYD